MYEDPRLTGIKPRSASWSPDGKVIAFLWNDQGTRFYDLWLCDASGSKPRQVTDAAAIAESASGVLTRAEQDRLGTLRRSGGGIFDYTWSPCSKKILFPLRGDLFLLNVKSGRARRLFRTQASETDAKFSPDGKRVSFIRENNIWLFDLELGLTVQLTDSGTETLYNGLGDYIDYEEVGREEAYWWSPDGSKIAYVQSDVSGVRELLIPDYLGDFVEVRKQPRPVAGGANGLKRLGVLDVESRETVWIDPGVVRDEYIVNVFWHPGGKDLLLLSEPRHLQELYFFRARCGDGSLDTLIRVRDDKWVNVNNTFVRWGKEGRYLYYTTEESGWNHIYRTDWEAGGREQLTSGNWEVKDFLLADERGNLWFTSTEVEPEQVHLFRQEKGGSRFRVTEGTGAYAVKLSPCGKKALVDFSNLLNPGDLYLLKSLRGSPVGDISPEEGILSSGNRGGGHVPVLYSKDEFSIPGNLKRITSSPVEDFYKLQIAIPRYFTLKSKLDGEEIHALILLPPELADLDWQELEAGGGRREFTEKYPAIISVHGGGYAHSVTKGWSWNSLFNTYLVNVKKYIILDLDYRGSSGYGRKFRTDVHLDIGGSDLEDEMTGYDYLCSLPFVDSGRIGIWGWSYGGYMTTLAMLRYPEAFRAGAGVAPVNDWKNYDTHYTEERLGKPRDKPEAYKKGSPITYGKNLKNHLLMIHGMADDNVHFQDTVQLVDALLEAEVDFEVMFYPRGTHGIRDDSNRKHLFRKIVRHFERYLRDIPDATCP
ncbi:MAG: DPP IV N-terminal domain-containing protein [Candidatus Krumholzibacteriota bacterium]|nr:DPP IV N-terminal domain-containing protein [Candidatus Krumholzibacteriota bacterium]